MDGNSALQCLWCIALDDAHCEMSNWININMYTYTYLVQPSHVEQAMHKIKQGIFNEHKQDNVNDHLGP